MVYMVYQLESPDITTIIDYCEDLLKDEKNDFFADMNPSLWNGSTSMPKSFDDRAWQYPLTDDVNLEITFVYNEEDGWCHYCDLVYQSDDSSFDMLSGYGIDSILNVTDTVMDLCRDY